MLRVKTKRLPSLDWDLSRVEFLSRAISQAVHDTTELRCGLRLQLTRSIKSDLHCSDAGAREKNVPPLSLMNLFAPIFRPCCTNETPPASVTERAYRRYHWKYTFVFILCPKILEEFNIIRSEAFYQEKISIILNIIFCLYNQVYMYI